MTVQNRPPRPWFRIEAKAASDAASSADVYIYDEIGDSWWGGVSPKALIDEITALDVDELRVFINSPGGAAWDGIAIMNALRRHKARVVVTVDALAASAASAIAMAGDRIIMNRGAEIMVHDAWGVAMGDAALMLETAGILDKLSDSYADIYATRGGTRDEWRERMRAESWFTAEEAVTVGLADEWVDAPAATAAFDLSRFRFKGRAQAPAPRLEAPMLPSSSEPGEPNRKEIAVENGDFQAGIRERLGVTDADASDETLLAALDEALAERAEPKTEMPSVPEGATVIDAAALAELREQAALGAQARREQEAGRRDAIVSAAVTDGRIAPSARDQWRAQLDKDEDGIKTLLESFPKNTVPVAELGHSDTAMSADEALYANAWGKEEEN